VSGAALFRRNRGAKFTSTPECALSTFYVNAPVFDLIKW
jgi:hypothetical protein